MLQAGVVGHHCLQLHRARFQLQNLGSLLCVRIFQHTCKAMLQAFQLHSLQDICCYSHTLCSVHMVKGHGDWQWAS